MYALIHYFSFYSNYEKGHLIRVMVFVTQKNKFLHKKFNKKKLGSSHKVIFFISKKSSMINKFTHKIELVFYPNSIQNSLNIRVVTTCRNTTKMSKMSRAKLVSKCRKMSWAKCRDISTCRFQKCRELSKFC